MGDGAVFGPPWGAVEAVSNRGGTGGRSVRYVIWYQVIEGGLYSRVEMARLDDAQGFGMCWRRVGD